MKTWVASTQDQVTLELDLSVLDKALLPYHAGLSESERANVATFYRAIDLLSTYKEVPTDASPTKARVEVHQGVTITEAGAELPTYAAGKASLLGKDISGNIGESQAAGSLLHFGLNGIDPPSQTASTPLKEVEPAVTLNISSVKETNRYTGGEWTTVVFDVELTWHANMKNPVLEIGCAGGNTFEKTGQNGSLTTNASDYIYGNNETVIYCTAIRPSDLLTGIHPPLAVTSLVVKVDPGTGKISILPSETATSTATLTHLTPTHITLTPTVDLTQNAMETEVSADKTAEFVSTITAIARQTEKAAQASIITLNGTFGLTNHRPMGCNPLQLRYPEHHSQFCFRNCQRHPDGGGTTNHPGYSIEKFGMVVRYDVSCTQSYTGSFSGGLDPASGAINLSGNVTGSNACIFTNCSTDGEPMDCINSTEAINNPLTITGTIYKDSGTGHGTLRPVPAARVIGVLASNKTPIKNYMT